MWSLIVQKAIKQGFQSGHKINENAVPNSPWVHPAAPMVFRGAKMEAPSLQRGNRQELKGAGGRGRSL